MNGAMLQNDDEFFTSYLHVNLVLNFVVKSYRFSVVIFAGKWITNT